MTISDRIGKLTAAELAAEIEEKDLAHREEMSALRAVHRVLVAREKQAPPAKPVVKGSDDD